MTNLLIILYRMNHEEYMSWVTKVQPRLYQMNESIKLIRKDTHVNQPNL